MNSRDPKRHQRKQEAQLWEMNRRDGIVTQTEVDNQCDKPANSPPSQPSTTADGHRFIALSIYLRREKLTTCCDDRRGEIFKVQSLGQSFRRKYLCLLCQIFTDLKKFTHTLSNKPFLIWLLTA